MTSDQSKVIATLAGCCLWKAISLFVDELLPQLVTWLSSLG